MTQPYNQLPVTRATPGAMGDRQLPATATEEIHTFTLVFPGGAIAVLHVHGAPDQDEARAHTSLVLPHVSYAVVDGDETHGHVVPFHAWTKRHLSLLVIKQVWLCEMCRKVGCVELDPKSAAWSAAQVVGDDHRAISAPCTNGVRGLRIINAEMILSKEVLRSSIPAWAVDSAAAFLNMQEQSPQAMSDEQAE